ncbi:hypothetical protein QYM36_004803 [Artemia franciscana]|uniref:Uncharacterized protein n=1 Tax=Artemia franciscana TaxID=6661 RepID=A0AA88HXT2_ARTSF|nr:hypothetical protein QYM36_004803 [Artemia franciscana]
MSHQTKPGKRKFINKKGNWPMFKQILQEANYNLLEDFSQIDDKVKILNKIMMEAAYKAIPKTSPNIWTPTGNKRIKNWWNELCSTAVEAKRVAKKAFQRHPSMSTAIEYKRSSAKVKKTCLQAKREAWEKFMTNIDHQTAVSKIHQYVSKMNGKRMTLDDRKYEIKHQGQLITSDFLKADIFANTFMKKPLDTVLPNPPVCVLPSVAQHKKSLMLPFSLSELQTAIERCNLNSAPGYDEIHIKWLIETPDIFRAKLLEEGEVGIAVLFDWTDAYGNVKRKKLQEIMHNKNFPPLELDVESYEVADPDFEVFFEPEKRSSHITDGDVTEMEPLFL